MAKKPIRVFRGQGGATATEARSRVYKDAGDADRMSITQEVFEYPKEHVKRAQTVKSDRYVALLHCIYDAVLITDARGAIIEVNARSEHIFNYSTEDLKSMNVTDVIAGADAELLAVLAEAIEHYRENHHSLVIMDVAMPAMSGEEAFANINAISETNRWKAPRFVFCTGFVVSENLRAIIGDGSVHTCLKKPLTMSDLVTAVRTRLAGLPQE